MLNRRLQLLFAWVAVVSTAVGIASLARAQEQTPREELAEHYIAEHRKNPSLFQGTPISHVVPSFNTISYALAGGTTDATIKPETENPSYPQELRLSGYEVAPYLSLSLRRIGLGFSVESGHKESEFTSSFGGGQSERRVGEVDYRGVGVFLYWIPTGKIARMITPTLILGGRNYTAKHAHASFFGGTSGVATNLSYSVPNYEAGLNIDVAMLKALHVIPWGNYSYMDTGDATSQVEKRSWDEDYLTTDIDLFWHSRPDLTYGIDFAARFGALQVRLGGVLGMLATSGQGSERIVDESLRLAFSIEQKGH